MSTTPNTTGSILALDVGSERVGIARASSVARLPAPLATLRRGPDFFQELQKLITDEAADKLVVGLPRGLSGQHTSQTKAIEDFVAELRQHTDATIYLQDEAVTSRKAEAELQQQKKPYRREDIDALAATYILEDFLQLRASSKEVTS